MIPFDVQLIGGMACTAGSIAEMATGEGKTLVATLPVYLNALTGRGVHVVTVNDYLAARDSEWMGAVYKFLGLTVGCILHDQPPTVRREQYDCDITYGTNAEFGFDYLRDNGMATRKESRSSAAITSPSWTKWTPSSSTKRARRSSSAVRRSSHTDEQDLRQVQARQSNRSCTHQERLCNRFLTEAEELIKKLRPEDGSNPQSADELEREIGSCCFTG